MSDLITILGPTATGKTRLAALLASRINGEIISADSRQVYRGMDIGTGKDLKDYTVDGQQIPVHLVDIADPGEEYNLFSFQQDFYRVYQQIRARGKMPLMCGGTGLYLESVLAGYAMHKVPVNDSLRKELEPLSHEELIEILKNEGPLHNTTDITDRKRTIRAIEIKRYEKEHPGLPKTPEINSLNFGIRFDRATIKKRITERLKKRLENGMTEEVESLLKSGLKPEQLTFYGLEYRYVTRYVTGEINYDTMFSELNTAIHQFSKRQMTWFRRMEKKGITIHWIEGYLPTEEKVNRCLDLIKIENPNRFG